jgi:hypothetical protein
VPHRRAHPPPVDIDHPSVGADHIYLPGSADSLVAATRCVVRSTAPSWLTVAREHRLAGLLDRPLSEGARRIVILGYSGDGDPALREALLRRLAACPVHWLSTTTGRLHLAASELSGVRLETLPGGSLVPTALRITDGPRTADDQAAERLGYVLGRYAGYRADRAALALTNRLHAASVAVRNDEVAAPRLVYALAGSPVDDWGAIPELVAASERGERLIRDARAAIRAATPARGGSQGPGLWLMPAGVIARGAHGKAIAAETYRRVAPCALVEAADRGVTKAWVVLPARADRLWDSIAACFARFSSDFSYTGRRGGGAVPAADAEAFADALWVVLRSR